MIYYIVDTSYSDFKKNKIRMGRCENALTQNVLSIPDSFSGCFLCLSEKRKTVRSTFEQIAEKVCKETFLVIIFAMSKGTNNLSDI